MTPAASITVSHAAAALHPGLAAAIAAAGGAPGADGTVRVVADHEPPDDAAISVGRVAPPRLNVERGRLSLAFDTPDHAFAAALIVAHTRGDAPAAAAPASLALAALTARVAACEVAVLIAGPTGTGKEELARSVHRLSPRSNRPFVAVNCAALPEAMLEALLFGHERGAFTGAAGSAKGLFRAADGGTLLLDEVAELPLALQAKLLRTLQEREVLPIGATVPYKIDVRIVAAANRDLAAEVAAGRFRADLYYRLAVFPLTTTALAARPADIVPVAAALWLRQGQTAWPTAGALARLVAHDWPGNVRELSNVLQRAAVMADGDRIEAGDIVLDAAAPAEPGASLGGAVRAREFAVIRSTLADCAGRRIDTARRLGISERTLRYKLAAMSAVSGIAAGVSAVSAAPRAMTMQ